MRDTGGGNFQKKNENIYIKKLHHKCLVEF